MYLEIVTPEKTAYSGDVKLVRLPGSKGSFEILKNHAPIISTLSEGQIKIATFNGEEKFFDVKQGVVEVRENNVVVLVENV